VKNEDKIDESHKSQLLKFEYEIYLLNYTNKNQKTYIGLLRFFRTKNLGFFKPTSTALRKTRAFVQFYDDKSKT